MYVYKMYNNVQHEHACHIQYADTMLHMSQFYYERCIHKYCTISSSRRPGENQTCDLEACLGSTLDQYVFFSFLSFLCTHFTDSFQ